MGCESRKLNPVLHMVEIISVKHNIIYYISQVYTMLYHLRVPSETDCENCVR